MNDSAKYLLDKFDFKGNYPFHHSNPNGLENKIYTAIDHQIPFLPHWVEKDMLKIIKDCMSPQHEIENTIEAIISATYLLTFDCSGIPTAIAFAKSRLSKMMTFKGKKGEDYYLSLEEKKKLSVPKKYWEKPVINPVFDPYIGICPLPTIHDIYLLRAAATCTGEFFDHAQRILPYILSDTYQNGIPYGYGYSWYLMNKRIYATGWSCHLGCSYDDRDIPVRSILPNLALFASFRMAEKTKIFRQAQQFIQDELRNHNGIFPPELLNESRSGYWVLGAYMSYAEKLTHKSRARISELRTQKAGILSV